MRSPPDVVVVPHLDDVMHDVALVMLEPIIQLNLPTC